MPCILARSEVVPSILSIVNWMSFEEGEYILAAVTENYGSLLKCAILSAKLWDNMHNPIFDAEGHATPNPSYCYCFDYTTVSVVVKSANFAGIRYREFSSVLVLPSLYLIVLDDLGNVNRCTDSGILSTNDA